MKLGIGTGRIALPLKARGLEISGIDASEAMLQKLKEKPHGTEIPLSVGNFADLPIDGQFELIFVVFNTFFALPTQELQLKCLENVKLHLTKEGRFLIEAFVPDISRFIDGQTVRATNIQDNEVRLDVSMHDRSVQQITSQHVVITDKAIRMYPVKIRYVWPSELDMMARVAGLRLISRWEDWKRSPFSSNSGRHISVFGLL